MENPNAQPIQDRSRNSFDDWAEHPEGRPFGKVPAIYECWLSERGEDRKLGPPRKLFKARVNHIGLIAANLAMRWHPAGDRLLFINRGVENKHQVQEWDLNDDTSRLAAPFDAENLLFDWSPDGTRLALVVEGAESPQNNGIWIGSPEKADWWQVPFSNPILQEGEADKLHRLRKLRPVWSRDGRRFAFVVPGSSRAQCNVPPMCSTWGTGCAKRAGTLPD